MPGTGFDHCVNAVHGLETTQRQGCQLAIPGGIFFFDQFDFVRDPALQIPIAVAAVEEQFAPTDGFFVAIHGQREVVVEAAAGRVLPQTQ